MIFEIVFKRCCPKVKLYAFDLKLIFLTDYTPKMDLSELPLTHPNLFSNILLNCEPRDLLSCRATCLTWRSWFSSSSSIWAKFVSKLLETKRTELFENSSFLKNYRIRKLLEHQDTDTEAGCLQLCMKISRILREKSDPKVSQDTMKRVKKLENSIPVMGPPAIFIRVKVDHPVIKKIIGEMLSSFLNCIILDREDAAKEFVKMFVFRSMYGQDGAQNFVYVDNLRPKDDVEEDDSDDNDDGPEGLVLEGEHRLAEALKMSMQSSSRGEKRKHEDEAEAQEGQSSKKARGENSDQDEEIDEKTSGEVVNEGAICQTKSIYEIEQGEISELPFPTLLDLLEIDNHVVQTVLIERCRIDRILVIPQFEKFLEYLPRLQGGGKTIVGCDFDGKVHSINPDSFEGSDNILIGSIDTPLNIASPNPERLLEAWGGRDKRHLWPEFARHLEEVDKVSQADQAKPGPSGVFNPVVMSPNDDVNGDGEKNTTLETVPDIFASLAARGISIVKK